MLQVKMIDGNSSQTFETTCQMTVSSFEKKMTLKAVPKVITSIVDRSNPVVISSENYYL